MLVMIVDDNDDVRFTIKESLISIDKKYEFVEASSGDKCLTLLEKQKPDLILMDIMMPGTDGSQTAVKIKENPKLKKIPILFLTAKTDEFSKGIGAVVGEDFIEKPFDPEDLDRRIKAALKKT